MRSVRCKLLVGMFSACLWILFGFAASASADSVSGCANQPSSPANIDGTLYAYFTCTLYNSGGSSTFDLTPYMTQGGANLSDNVVGAGYVVVMNGDPLVVSDNDLNDAALYNQSLWEAVLFWPGDQDAGFASDSLTVYWPGAFPTSSDVQTFDESLYGAGADSLFFVEATGPETVYAPSAPNAGNEYDIYTTPLPTPEPGTFGLLLTGMSVLGLPLGMKRLQRRARAEEA